MSLDKATLEGAAEAKPCWPGRPTLELIKDGVPVFVRATAFGGGVSMLQGRPSVSVMIGGDDELRSVTSTPLSCVTRADGYVSKDAYDHAERHRVLMSERADELARAAAAALEAMKRGVRAEDIEALDAVVNPKPEPEDDEW